MNRGDEEIIDVVELDTFSKKERGLDIKIKVQLKDKDGNDARNVILTPKDFVVFLQINGFKNIKLQRALVYPYSEH